MKAPEPPTLREPWDIETEHGPRRRTGVCHGCLEGDHERCVDLGADRGSYRCVCGCSKVDPWPWPCAEEPAA